MRTFRIEEEILALLDEYDDSNMTVKEFCELCDISDPTFTTCGTNTGRNRKATTQLALLP